MLQTTFKYIGVFFDYDTLWDAVQSFSIHPLSKKIQAPHVTFVYKPSEVPTELFGIPIRVRAVGYGNNRKNEGLFVELSSENPVLQTMISNIPVPHITLSVSHDSKPVFTKDLEFTPIPPFELQGFFGGYSMGDKVVLSPGKMG